MPPSTSSRPAAPPGRKTWSMLIAAGGLLWAGSASAQTAPTAPEVRLPTAESFVPQGRSGRLLLTGGVTNFEGASGGGLTPWATIAGYGTREQIGGTVFGTFIPTRDYQVYSTGAAIGLYNRLELSYARSTFNTLRVGGDLGLGRNFTFNQDIFGVKLRLFGDLVLDQDSWLPQVSVGTLIRRNDRGPVVSAVGGQRSSDADYYVSATKLFLAQSLLVNATLRVTRANQFGFLGFGGDRNRDYSVRPEISAAYLLNRNVAVGAEYRMRPNNLGIAREGDAYDFFVAWAPTRNISLTAGFVDLGRIVTRERQRGAYLSLTVGF